jgi:acyl carrier protein
LKNLILAGGENYHAEDIESSVLQETSAAVALAAAFAVDIDDRQKVVLLLERHRDWRHSHDPAALATLAQRARHTVRDSLGLEIDDVVVVRPAALPRTSSGKRQHTHYAALYLASTLPGIEYRLPVPTAYPTNDQPEKEIWALGWLAELTNTPASQLDIQQPFHSLGLGSLQTALLLARLHTELGIVVPPAALNPDASLGELVALISVASPHKAS